VATSSSLTAWGVRCAPLRTSDPQQITRLYDS
jgi:hypothetical protein